MTTEYWVYIGYVLNFLMAIYTYFREIRKFKDPPMGSIIFMLFICCIPFAYAVIGTLAYLTEDRAP